MGNFYLLVDVFFAFSLENIQLSHLTEPTVNAERQQIMEALLGLREGSVNILSDNKLWKHF